MSSTYITRDALADAASRSATNTVSYGVTIYAVWLFRSTVQAFGHLTFEPLAEAVVVRKGAYGNKERSQEEKGTNSKIHDDSACLQFFGNGNKVEEVTVLTEATTS